MLQNRLVIPSERNTRKCYCCHAPGYLGGHEDASLRCKQVEGIGSDMIQHPRIKIQVDPAGSSSRVTVSISPDEAHSRVHWAVNESFEGGHLSDN